MTALELAAKTDAFVQKWTGHLITTDGNFPRAWPYQCWDLADQFGKEVTGCPILNTRPGGNGGAVDCYRLFIAPLPGFYTRYALGSVTPRKGDLIIWNENLGDGEGHISIYLAPTGSGFISFDQNWPVGSAPKMVSHNWTNVLGILRPITQEDEMISDADNEYGRWNKLFMQIRGRNASRDEFRAAAVGQTWLHAMETLSDNAEADQATQWQNVGQVATRDDWAGQIAGLQKQVNDLKTQTDELAKRPTKEQFDQLQTQVNALHVSATAAGDTVNEPQKLPAANPTSPSASWFIRLLTMLPKLGKKK